MPSSENILRSGPCFREPQSGIKFVWVTITGWHKGIMWKTAGKGTQNCRLHNAQWQVKQLSHLILFFYSWYLKAPYLNAKISDHTLQAYSKRLNGKKKRYSLINWKNKISNCNYSRLTRSYALWMHHACEYRFSELHDLHFRTSYVYYFLTSWVSWIYKDLSALDTRILKFIYWCCIFRNWVPVGS